MSTVTVANGSGGRNADLASKLRACAYHVERNEFNPVLYQALALLHAYAGEHSSTEPAPDAPAHAKAGPAAASAAARAASPPRSGNYGGGATDAPFDEDRPKRSAVAGIPGDAFDDVDIEHTQSHEERRAREAHAASLAGYGLKDFASDIGKDINKLGKKFSKATGLSHSDSSAKHASGARREADWLAAEGIEERSKRERGHRAGSAAEGEWCEEHFCVGCTCKARKLDGEAGGGNAVAQEAHPSGTAAKAATAAAAATATAAGGQAVQSRPRPPASKPCFQRPVNSTSNLIANGWIEQQRRSKLRVVWKDILASLVEGRRPGEETTLWIQRQITSAATGKAELEALHQIPMKWLEDVTYVDFYGDHRFSLKIFNVPDEFQFRTTDKSSAESWVATLRSARDASLGKVAAKEGGERPTAGEAKRMDEGLQDEPGAVPRAGSHDANEAAAATATAAGAAAAHAHAQHAAAAAVGAEPQPQPQPRRTVKELRAIAHGQGIDTRGMERADLEQIAARYAPAAAAQAQAPPASSSRGASPVPPAAAAQRQQQAGGDEQAAWRAKQAAETAARAEAVKKLQEEAERKRRAAAAEGQEAAARRAEAIRQEEATVAAAAEDDRRRQTDFAEKQAAERRQRAAEEAERQRREAAAREAQARAQAAEEERRRQAAAAAEAERKRKEAEAQAQWQQQQAGWQNQQQQQAEWQRQQAAQQEEARKRAWQQQQAAQQAQQQAWQQQQQAHAQPPPPPQQHAHAQPPPPPPQHAHAQPPPPPPRQAHAAQPPPPPGPPPPQQHQQQHQSGPGSPINNKYAKFAQGGQQPSSADAKQAAVTRIKRDILVNWALLPPGFQMLKPIDQLVASIHAHFPPAHGVPGHEYFAKFKPIPHSDLVLGGAMGNAPSEDKLKKAIRRIRFFLHPDKLPRDLGAEQSFAVKMLWDVTSDAWEEFCKQKEELDWIH